MFFYTTFLSVCTCILLALPSVLSAWSIAQELWLPFNMIIITFLKSLNLLTAVALFVAFEAILAVTEVANVSVHTFFIQSTAISPTLHS